MPVKRLRELSIFIDESGDFGEYSAHSPYYIIAMVFHDQSDDIRDAVDVLDRELSNLGFGGLCIHTGPIVRKEEIYARMEVDERRRIFNKMTSFFRQVNIRYKCFHIENFKGNPRCRLIYGLMITANMTRWIL